MEKKLGLALFSSVLALAGVVILLVLQFRGPSNNVTEQAVSAIRDGKGASIVFINSDSLKSHYELVKEMQVQLENNFRVRESEINARQSSYEKDAAYFQEQVQKKTISEASAQSIYEDLMKNQQDLYELRERYTDELAQQEYEMNLRFIDSVDSFLKRFNQEKGFDYILGYSKGSGILMARDTFDITREVIDRMNEEYLKSKQK